MAQDTIRFRKIAAGSDLIAVAEVPLFRGVYLRGWNIMKKGEEIEVMPPHKIYTDPQTGERRILPLLTFISEEMRQRWLTRVKEEYLIWERHDTSVPPGQPKIGKE